MAGLTDKIYAASPVWAQQLAISAFGLMWKSRRYGGDFQREVAAFGARDFYSPEQWRDYQTAQLRRLLRRAAWHVPHYRESFAAAGFAPRDFETFTLEDLARLPILEKDAIRRDPQNFVAENSGAKKLHSYSTSGTTGTPLQIRMSSATHRKSAAAYETRCRNWAGVDFTMSRAMIGGRIVVPQADSAPPFWRYNAAEKQLYMSAFHISPKTAREYSQAINKLKPEYLVGYASSHYFLARFLEEQNIAMHRPRAILTSSEKLTDEMRATLQRVYGCEVFDGYSGVEACCLASECENHRLHLSPDVGYVELLDESGAPVAAGETGEIVATGFLNFDQPLIRYRTGDMAIFSAEACTCGRSMPVLQQLLGRQEDVVTLPDGRRSASFYKVLQGLEGIQEAQIIQEELDLFTFFLVTDSAFTPSQREALLNNICTRYGKVRVELKLVEKIERTKNGKLRLVISRVQNAPATREYVD